MSSSRVASIRYHSNYPCALPWNVSFTRHTTSFLRWISHLWMAIHFMTRQPSEVIPWKGRLKKFYIKTGKNTPFPIESITQQGSSPPCCNYTILPNMSKLDQKNSLLSTCSPSSCRSGGSKWNKHFQNPAGVDLYTCWNFWCCPWLLIDFHTARHNGEPTPSTEISCQRGSSIHANTQVWYGFSNITWKPHGSGRACLQKNPLEPSSNWSGRANPFSLQPMPLRLENLSLGIQSYSQLLIGVSNHLLSKVFRFHYHSQKVNGSLGYCTIRSTNPHFYAPKTPRPHNRVFYK